jgi:hypothetical protein
MGEASNAEKTYQKFQAKYSLPDMDVLDREFSLGEIDDTPFVLRSRMKIRRLSMTFSKRLPSIGRNSLSGS